MVVRSPGDRVVAGAEVSVTRSPDAVQAALHEPALRSPCDAPSAGGDETVEHRPVGRREIKTGRGEEPDARLGAVAGPQERLAPLQMQAAPVGGVARGLLEFRE